MAKSQLISKPWGYEYLLYETPQAAVWCLHILPDQATSLHSHPNKKSGLVILSGHAEVSFMHDSIKLNPLDKIMIRQGLFHSTKCISHDELIMLEIENPKNKDDIIRFRDNYGRQTKPFIADSVIKNDGETLTDKTDIGLCTILVNRSHVFEIDLYDDSVYMITGGKIYDKEYIDGNVVTAGDVISGLTLSTLISSGQFDSGVLEYLRISRI